MCAVPGPGGSKHSGEMSVNMSHEEELAELGLLSIEEKRHWMTRKQSSNVDRAAYVRGSKHFSVSQLGPMSRN